MEYTRVTGVSFRFKGKSPKVFRKIVTNVYAVSENDSEQGIGIISECIIEYCKICVGLVHMGISRHIEGIIISSFNYSSTKIFVHPGALFESGIDLIACRHKHSLDVQVSATADR